GIRDFHVTGVQTCALPIYPGRDVRCQTGVILFFPALMNGKRTRQDLSRLTSLSPSPKRLFQKRKPFLGKFVGAVSERPPDACGTGQLLRRRTEGFDDQSSFVADFVKGPPDAGPVEMPSTGCTAVILVRLNMDESVSQLLN